MSDRPRLRIAVIGAGAIGSLVGGLLARAGEDVTLVARPAHAEAIRGGGLRIRGILGEFTVQPRASEALNFRPDLVLLATKTQDVGSACRSIYAYARDVPIVTLQNGVRSDDIAASVFPRGYILSGIVLFNAQYLRPGEITYARSGPLVIGEAFGRNGQRVKDIQALLGRAVHTEISDSIQGAHWTKLLVNNVANGLEAMCGLSVRDCLHHTGLRGIGAQALREGYQAIKVANIRLAPLPGVPLPVLRLIALWPLSIASRVLSLSMGSLRTLSSTLQSLLRGRPTEIEYLNGEIVRLGRQVGMATPWNSEIVDVVREVERNRQFYRPDDLVHRFMSH